MNVTVTISDLFTVTCLGFLVVPVSIALWQWACEYLGAGRFYIWAFVGAAVAVLGTLWKGMS